MKLLIILFVGLLGAGRACLGSLAIERATSSSSSQSTSRRIEKNDLLKRVMKALPADKDAKIRNALFTAAVSILNESYETNVRHIVSAEGKNTFGENFPLDAEVLMDIMDLSQGKKVLEIAAANGENSFLLGLAGAEKVFINDIEPTELDKCRTRLNSLPEDEQAKFTILPGDCLKVFASDEYTACFDVIYARNIMHFLFGEKREQFIRTVSRLLKPGGRLIITVNSAQRFLPVLEIDHISHQYVFKYRGYKLRLPERHINLFQTFAVEDNLSDVDPLRYRHVPVVRFTVNGPEIEKEFENLTSEDIAKLKQGAAKCIKECGLLQLTVYKRTIECHENQFIAYTASTLEEAFAGSDLRVLKSVSTDLAGHATARQNEEAHLTMFFNKSLHLD